MRRAILLLAAWGAGGAPGAARAARPATDTSAAASAVRPVAHVDLRRYMGTWYEIARLPNRYQRGCTASTATYALRSDGLVSMTDRCRLDSLTGPERVITARARVADTTTNAKLEVQFIWPIWGKYWVMDLDADYRWAVVGHPLRKYLWVLSRTPAMDPAVYAGIVRRIAAQGYDTTMIVRTPQPVGGGGAR